MSVSIVLSSRSLRRMEASTLLSFPGVSIFIVTKLQLEFHVDLVKNLFCAIGGFEDLAAPCLGQILMRVPCRAVRCCAPTCRGVADRAAPLLCGQRTGGAFLLLLSSVPTGQGEG